MIGQLYAALSGTLPMVITLLPGTKPPRVSVGLPVYNGERYVAAAIESILGQTFADWELIICDNASSDATEAICQFYAAKDARIRYQRNAQNLGATANYRRCFLAASGQYFKWASYDDLCSPELLARAVEVLDRDPWVVLAYGRTQVIDEAGAVVRTYDDQLHLANESASQRFRQLFGRLRLCNALYGVMRTSVLARTGLLGNFVGGDIPLLAELTLYGKFWELPDAVFYRRLDPACSSTFKKVDEVLELYDPQLKAGSPLTECKHLIRHIRSVRRAPVRWHEKLSIGLFLLRVARWGAASIRAELWAAVRSGWRRVLRKVPLAVKRFSD